ncbi:MAG: hypothetical protein KDC24_13940, partial [Saprospiraceae bacterium]|nr:hypothetical protein [Saprospiraceae bacterium]
MTGVFLKADNMISSLGFSSEEHVQLLKAGQTGIKAHPFPGFSALYTSAVDDVELENRFRDLGLAIPMSRLEKMMAVSISAVLKKQPIDLADPSTGFIFSTTKGNIDLLGRVDELKRLESSLLLQPTAQKVWKALGGNDIPPLVVCNACISGLVAIIHGARMIERGQYKNVIVTGADVLSDFIITGFNALKALGTGPCRPFDKNRDGISLGEGCGTVLLSGEGEVSDIQFLAGAISNDANHISGPSRTASGLVQAVKEVNRQIDITPDYISAHGTATLYNDEMEAIGFQQLGLQDIPVNSFKGYWGHTLGAAGVLETLAASYSLKEDTLFESVGYENQGT